MGFLDRLKSMLGKGDDEAAAPAPTSEAGAATTKGPRTKRERPPLAAPPAPSASLDDALDAREKGDRAGSRAILQAIDRGAGLRTVLRAAAALEANDEEELALLLPKLESVEAPWRLDLQVATAISGARAGELIARAERAGAPPWALGWARCATTEGDAQRKALVELLFVDAPIARTVAARDLKLEGVHEDATAIGRYASLDAGRAAVRRFGAEAIVALLDRIDAQRSSTRGGAR